MTVLSDVLLAIAVEVVAGILLHIICKWLDGKDK